MTQIRDSRAHTLLPLWALWHEGTGRLHLLFAGQHEYVFSYGPSPSYLKVVLSTIALNLFSVQDLTPVQLATYVAEWALVMGQVCGTVRLAGNLVLSDCYGYYQQQARRHSSPRQSVGTRLVNA